MGYQRNGGRSLAGGGGGGGRGGVAVVRCSCAEEEVKISFRSVGDERRLRWVFARRWFDGLLVPLLFRFWSKPSEDGESSRLSSASISSDERAPSDSPYNSSDPPPGQRPLSQITCSSSDDNIGPPQLSAASSSPELNQIRSPGEGKADTEGLSPEPGGEDRKSFVHNNNNNKAWIANRTSSRRQSASPFVRATMAPNPNLTYLDRVIMEIIETERMYVRDLRIMVEEYLACIIDHPKQLIHPDQVCALFGNIADIYELNNELLHDLDMCENDPVAIARCFVEKSEYFDIYTQYCTNYPNSVAALTECLRDKSTAKFLRDRQASLKRTLPLGSYLLKPVQRILKYHLLLQEIAKHFDPEEEGYEVVEEAIYTMTGVAWYINDMKRKHEHAVRLQEVQSLLLNWTGPDLASYGELVLEGTFKVHRAKNERTLFLFDRMLLFTKRRGEHYVYKTHIPCTTLMLIESAKDSLSFSVTQYKNPKQPHTVQAKTVEEKKLWAHHIKRIIVENHHAIIPQKAKEAILEMDSIYPSKYRFSPERLKKAGNSDESARKGRFPTDANKKMRKSTKASKELSDSEGDRRSLQLAESSSTLDSSSLGESDCDQEEVGDGKESHELMCSDEEDDEEEEEGEFLLKDEQESDKDQNLSTKRSGQLAEEATTQQSPAVALPQEKTLEQAVNSEEKLLPDLDPPRNSQSPPKPEALKEELRHTEEPTPATPDSDSKILSSGESSEDEEEEADEHMSPSILPSSVLDKASAIAQHFTSSVKRSNQGQDDTRSIGCPSPRLPSRTGSCLSLAAESADQPPRLNSVSSDTVETFSGTDLTLMSPREDKVFDLDRSIRRRKDSTLSKHDQLLIGKIKNYYESAGGQDSTFSLRRRESLTYIPSGLVRNSVTRFNSIPNEEGVPTSTSSNSLDGLSADSNTPFPEEPLSHLVSSHSLDSLRSEQLSTDSGEHFRSRSHDNLSEEEEFRPSSQMIKVWKEMERQISKSHSEDGACNQPSKASRENSIRRCNPTKTRSPSDSEVDSTSLSSSKPLGVSRSSSLKNTLRLFGEEAVHLRATVPRVAQLRAEEDWAKPSENLEQSEEMDKAQSKVLQLARRYSQRIKSNKPEVRQLSQNNLIGKTSLARVVEEESSDQVPPPDVGSTSSSRVISQSRVSSRSPLSPSPSIEGFSWPDVCELRSKYSNHSSSLKGSVSRSGSVGEQVFDRGMRRHSNSLLSDVLASEDPKHQAGWEAGQDERGKRVHRANSLDPRLSKDQMSELQRLQEKVANRDNDGYYIAAEALRPSDPNHKIIVMEKLPQPEETTHPKEEDDGGYVQIRSPTSREKISIMAVIDRCRAYQDSDEYKQREDTKAKTEPTRSQEPDKMPAASTKQEESQKTRQGSGQSGQQSMVKNLREKFQNRS
ncbi:pleckstrin homology domain-containing family G member 3 isoform X3 [Oryzias melastigma]|uniref:pleckstrin homology domain-containing family G member 3 isoform X3 n=1 Tax=Oryzias melastigma TaxID=30732 RepID=UPI00168CF9BA|nr:pleckstrin homology domain-containing family G member 3 isoform X3 [Oryzias melastigma]